MRKSYVIYILIIFFVSLFIWQCSWKGESVGTLDKIYVFADSTDWQYYEDTLNRIFGRYNRMPAAEREFLLVWVPFREFEKYQGYKNIFMLGTLGSGGHVSQVIKNVLDEKVLEGVKSGDYFFIPKKEVWAVDQYVLFLVANNQDEMIQKIIDYGDVIYKDFRDYYFQRLKKSMFKRMEQKNLEKYIAENFPFRIRVQHDYFIADENLKKNYLWIRRLHPDRSILIHWVKKPDDFSLTPRWVIDERNRLAQDVYSGDVIVEEETKAYNVTFKGRNAIQLKGTWRNDSLMIGGPFRNISFVDSETNRVYILDYYVQAIGERKRPYIDQLNVIIHTFQVLEKKGLDQQARKED